jgi:nucleotide-binding universal stress UspA family protein
MFKRIVAAYDGSKEAEHALVAAIRLAKSLNAELHAVTVIAALPAYSAFAEAADSSLTRVLEDDRASYYVDLHEKARALAVHDAMEIEHHVLDGHGVDPIVDFLRKKKADLLVVGLHQHNLYISRLWSRVYELAQEAPCDVLGVH